jgi:hypothetical protein
MAPLTAAQTTAFFEDAAQMGIPNATAVQLQAEGIDALEDLVDFDKATIEQIGATVPTPSFPLGAKSQQRLIDATKFIQYYGTVGRNTAAGNLQQWTLVMKNFSEQWKAVEDKKGGWRRT